jgi:hypothetical protein
MELSELQRKQLGDYLSVFQKHKPNGSSFILNGVVPGSTPGCADSPEPHG